MNHTSTLPHGPSAQPTATVAQRTKEICETAGRPEHPIVHHWLKAESKTIVMPEREVAAKRPVRADPADPA